MGELVRTRKASLKLATTAAVAALTLVLGGCQSSKMASSEADPITTGSTSEPGSLRETAAAAKLWESDKSNIKLGLAYSEQLQRLGRNQRQLQVLEELSQKNPQDPRMTALYGKKLLENGRAAAAQEILARAISKGDQSWQTYSALGSAYDAQGKYASARQQYQMALNKHPDQIKVLNNMAMSYALEGNLKEAENILRSTAAKPGADKINRIRQNLALVVGLQGRYDEARDIASRDLSPTQVEANLEYLQTMMKQKNTWNQLKSPS